MKSVLVEITEGHLKLLDELVEEKLYPSRNEAIRNAIRDLLSLHSKL